MYEMQELFRWIHVLAGILWIGMLYFFNFVNGPFQARLSPEAKREVVPQLMPRALWFFRWGAAWTWFTGVLLLGLVFWHRPVTFAPNPAAYGVGTLVSLVLVFGGAFVYDLLMRSSIFGDQKIKNTVGFVLIAMVIAVMTSWGGFGYRGWTIHTGVLFGTIMAFNVWFRIWPAQQQIIRAVRDGETPDGELVAQATLRSRHNTYLSVPLLWTMLNSHNQAVGDGLPQQLLLLGVILLGWHLVFQLYRRAAKLEGF